LGECNVHIYIGASSAKKTKNLLVFVAYRRRRFRSLSDSEPEEEEDEDDDEEEDDEEDDDEEELSLSLSLSELLLLSLSLLLDSSRRFSSAALFAAFLRCSRRSSVRPPRPMAVKKLIAKRVFFGLSRGKIPVKACAPKNALRVQTQKKTPDVHTQYTYTHRERERSKVGNLLRRRTNTQRENERIHVAE
jgi:hypothetical protein